jgi:hypothetical protein
MAGAGYKLFNTGDVLTAAQVNTYLNEQTVMVFADSAARTTALSGVLSEGMMSYLQDTDSVEVYDGTAWTAVGGGGLTSPLTTKGDVWGYSTTDARIPIGANNTVLTADSSESLGLKWAAPSSPSCLRLALRFPASKPRSAILRPRLTAGSKSLFKPVSIRRRPLMRPSIPSQVTSGRPGRNC